LVSDQKDWSKHLQAVAMAYRASLTTSLRLSPHEIVFGRKINFGIDWNLLTEEPMVCTEALGMKSLTMLAVTHKDKSLGPWETAQAMADAVCQFDVEMKERSNDERHLTNIEFINLTLDIADVTSFVFKCIFKVTDIQRDDSEVEDKQEGDIDAQPRLTGDLFDITGLLIDAREVRTNIFTY
jgi:hypothetical protein